MPRVKRSVHARKTTAQGSRRGQGLRRAAARLVPQGQGAAPPRRQPRLPRSPQPQARLPPPLDPPHQRRGAKGRPLVQPVRRRLPEGRDRARPEGARRPRGERPGRLHRGRGTRQGRTRSLNASSSNMITSASNARLKLVRKLASRRGRAKLGLFACEGEDLVAAGLDAGLEPVEALVDAERPALAERLPAAEHVEPEAHGRALDPRPSGPGRRRVPARRPAARRPCRGARALARRRPRQRRHAPPSRRGARSRLRRALGRLRRSDFAEGAQGLGRGGVSRPDRGLRRGAAALARARPAGGTPLPEAELGEGTFVLGAEREGLPDDVLARCDARLSIPQAPAAESLNVALAGAIALYERRRRL